MRHKQILTDSGWKLVSSARSSPVSRSPGGTYSAALHRPSRAPLRRHHLLPAPPRSPARPPAPVLTAAPAPCAWQSFGVLPAHSTPAPQPRRTPALLRRCPARRPPRSFPSRTAPREGLGGGPWPAGADWLPPWRPAPRARAGGGASRDGLGRARRGSADGASVTRVPAPVSLPGRSRGGGERAAAAGRSGLELAGR